MAERNQLDAALDRYHHSAAARELHAMVREPADTLRTLEDVLSRYGENADLYGAGEIPLAVAKRLLLDVIEARAALERSAALAIGEVASHG